MHYRILHILPWITSGGVERRRLSLFEHLDPELFEQRFVSKSIGGGVAERLEALNAPISLVPGSWTISDLDAIHGIMREIESFKPDIIHGAVFEGVTMAALCGYMSQVPHVIIEETGGTQRRSWRGDLLFSFTSMLSEKCVAISPYVARYVTERSQVPAHKLHTIVNGVTLRPSPPPEETRRLKAELGIPASSPVIGNIGRLFNEYKRISDIIEAFASLDPNEYEHPPYLVIGGAGPDEKMLKELGAKLGVDDRIVWLGYVSEPNLVYPMMDIFTLVSMSEAFGLVVIEAMAAGVPVVCARATAFIDIVDEGETGLLVPTFDPKSLAAALDYLLKHPEKRAAMGNQARVVAERDYSSQRYVRDVDAFYRDLLSNRD